MKHLRRILALSLCLTLTVSVASALAAEPFAYADLTVSGLPAGTSSADAVTILGTPLLKDDPTEIPATGDITQTYRYNGLILTFTDDKLSGAEMVTSDYIGPRGLTAGMSEEALSTLFPFDETTAQEGILYSSGWVEALGKPLPPCGTFSIEENNTLLYRYFAPVTPYSAALLAEPEGYIFEDTAVFVAVVDSETHNISSLTWSVQALAE